MWPGHIPPLYGWNIADTALNSIQSINQSINQPRHLFLKICNRMLRKVLELGTPESMFTSVHKVEVYSTTAVLIQIFVTHFKSTVFFVCLAFYVPHVIFLSNEDVTIAAEGRQMLTYATYALWSYATIVLS